VRSNIELWLSKNYSNPRSLCFSNRRFSRGVGFGWRCRNRGRGIFWRRIRRLGLKSFVVGSMWLSFRRSIGFFGLCFSAISLLAEPRPLATSKNLHGYVCTVFLIGGAGETLVSHMSFMELMIIEWKSMKSKS